MKKIWKKIVGTPVLTLLGGNAAASVLGLLIFLLLGRGLDSTSFGLWVLFTTATSMTDLILKGVVKSAYIWAIATAANDDQKSKMHAAAWWLNLILSLLIALFIWSQGILLPQFAKQLNLGLFFTFYPIYLVVSVPLNIITWRLQAQKRFGASQVGRLLVNILFAISVLLILLGSASIELIAGTYVITHALVSMIMIRAYPCELAALCFVERKDLKVIWDFGRHSVATLLGGSLLRGTDIYLISAWLGPQAVAIYSIPMKLIDFLDIPLRSLAMAEFSNLAKAWRTHRQVFLQLLHKLIALGTAVAIVAVISVVLTSGYIMNFFKVADAEMGQNLLWVFGVAMLALPAEKFLGIASDAVGRPDRNARKVWVMVIANVIGDVLALHFFNSVYGVAAVTILNQLLGIGYSSQFFQLSQKRLYYGLRSVYIQVRRKVPIPLIH